LIGCDDELFLRFLCETIHPVVRADVTDAEKICQLYNTYLKNDGYHLVEKTRMSGKPVFTGRHVGVIGAPGINAVKQVFSGTDTTYVAQQITREASVSNDPDLAIGTAKELIETCCRSILHERGIDTPGSANLRQLVKLTSKELQLTPEDIPTRQRQAPRSSDYLAILQRLLRVFPSLETSTAQGTARLERQKD
jgi:hypothetical protein